MTDELFTHFYALVHSHAAHVGVTIDQHEPAFRNVVALLRYGTTH